MSQIYHYCSLEALRGILENGTLRLSDIRKSNDSKEIDFLFNQYQRWLKENSEDPFWPCHNAEVSAIDEKTWLRNTVFLVICLSKSRDDYHMWNCYGKGGVSIGFNRKKLEEYLKRVRLGLPEIPQDVKKECSGFFSDAPVLKMGEVAYYDEASIEEFLSKQGLNGCDDFLSLYKESPFIKNAFFQSEAEVRIAYVHSSSSNGPNHLSLTDERGEVLKDIPFTSVSNERYWHKMAIDIPIDLDLIESITLAPDCKLSERDLEELAYIYGAKNATIEKSVGTLQ